MRPCLKSHNIKHLEPVLCNLYMFFKCTGLRQHYFSLSVRGLWVDRAQPSALTWGCPVAAMFLGLSIWYGSLTHSEYILTASREFRQVVLPCDATAGFPDRMPRDESEVTGHLSPQPCVPEHHFGCTAFVNQGTKVLAQLPGIEKGFFFL